MRIEQTRVAKLDKDGIVAEIDVRINNPNKTAFKVYKSTVEMSMNDVLIGKAHLKKKVTIKANTEGVYTFTVQSDLKNLASGGGLFGLLSYVMTNKADISLKGDVKVGKFFYRKAFPIDKRQHVPLIK